MSIDRGFKKMIWPVALAVVGLILGTAIYLLWPRGPEPPAKPGEVPGAQQPLSKERTIGLVAPLNGPLAPLGQSLKQGSLLAINAANAALKEDQRPFQLLVEDETTEVPDSERLAANPVVPVVVGYVTEGALEKALPAYLKAGKPLLLPVISGSEVTKIGGGWLYRTMPSDEDQARVLADFAINELKTKSALIVFEDSKYGRGLTETFGKRLSSGGQAQVEEVLFPEQPEDLLKLAERVKAKKPEIVLLAMHARPAIYILQAMAQANQKPTVLGTHALALGDIVPLLNRLSKRTFITLPFNYEQPGDLGLAFTKKFEDLYLKAPDWLCTMAFDAVSLAIAAIEAEGEDPGKIKAYLDKLNGPPQTFKGLVGEYYFQSPGRGVSPTFIVQVKSSLVGRVP